MNFISERFKTPLNERDKGKIKVFLGLIFIAFYLVVEVAFNAYLTDTVVRNGLYSLNISELELVGRSLASTGACIFCLGIVKNKKYTYIILPFIWLFIFTMQKYLVDCLVDLSSAEDRQKSYQLFSLVAASNDLMALREFGSSNILELSMLPSIMYFSDDAISELALEELNKNKKQVYMALNANAYGVNSLAFNKLYDDFTVANKNIKDMYKLYKKVTIDASIEGEIAWNNLRETHQLVKEIQANTGKNFSSFHRKGNELSDLLRKSYDGKGCSDELLSWQYKNGIARDRKYKRFLSHTELCDWQRGGSVKPPLFNGNEAYYKRQLLVILSKPYPIFSGVDYSQSLDSALSNKEFQSFLKKGNKSCYMKNILTKEDLVAFHLRCNVGGGQDGELKNRLISLKQNLTFNEFINDNNVRSLVDERYGIASGRLLHMLGSDDEAYFKNKVYPTLAGSFSREAYEKAESNDFGFFASKSEFNSNGLYHRMGDSSYRYVIILPVVMTLNLFFIAVTFIILVFRLGGVIYKDFFFKSILLSGLVTVVFILPAINQSEETDTNNILNWATSFQPIIYDIGRVIK
ncbi:MAG: hypothetical protein JJV99_00300 [Colwellia sp.]|nr:hypothetical protein [Colwellia sp.]